MMLRCQDEALMPARGAPRVPRAHVADDCYARCYAARDEDYAATA